MAKYTFKRGLEVKHINREDAIDALKSGGWELVEDKPAPKSIKKVKKTYQEEE